MGQTDLFTPIHMGPYTLSNRMVMAPLTRNRAGAGNVPHGLNALYYVQRAAAGLIVTEASQVGADAVGYPATPGIHSPEQVAGWQEVTAAVHDAGGRIFLQLWHTGRISHPSMLPGGALPVAPSAVKPAGEAFTYQGLQPFVTPRALEVDELPHVVHQYRQAAVHALAAGFDGVEIHAANGYLLDQFLRDGTNKRTDAYGGSFAGRARLLMEVADAVAEVWRPERVGVRISPVNPFNDMADSNPQGLFTHVAGALSSLGLAYLHVVEGAIGAPAGQAVDFGQIRAAFGGLYMANGGYDKARANEALASGRADLVSFGVGFLANPDLVDRFRKNAPLNTPNPATFYGGAAEGYTDYPTLAEAQAAG